jgi:SAM-dependent methyltransferase
MNHNIFNENFWVNQWDSIKQNTNKKTDDTYKIHTGFSTTEYWDNASITYNTQNNELASRKTDKIIKLLKKNKLIFKNCNILEIGCGTGLMAKEFAKNNCNVTAIDFSKGMIKRCLADIPENIEYRVKFLHLDWNKINLKQKKWQKKFDLVAAFMSPAISTPESFYKMIKASRRGCIIKGWAKKQKHDILDSLWKILMNRPLEDKPQNFLFKLNLLFSMGYFPELTFDKIEWEETIELKKELQTQLTFFRKISDKDDKELTKIITDYLKTIEKNNLIYKKHKGLTATAYWEIPSE